jgi:hypothetical protein
MASQTDLDQGGTSRQWVRSYMGPSVGWQYVPLQNVLVITAVGTYTIDPSTSLIQVNVAGAVTIILPSAVTPAAGAQAQPQLFAQNPITIVDIGGHAQANPITIQRNNANESIMGLASISLSVNYGGYVLQPNSALKTWNSISP